MVKQNYASVCWRLAVTAGAKVQIILTRSLRWPKEAKAPLMVNFISSEWMSAINFDTSACDYRHAVCRHLLLSAGENSSSGTV
jgi:hypothetical protein